MKSPIIIKRVEINQCSMNEFDFRGFAVSVNIYVHSGGVVFCSDLLFGQNEKKKFSFLFDSKNTELTCGTCGGIKETSIHFCRTLREINSKRNGFKSVQ